MGVHVRFNYRFTWMRTVPNLIPHPSVERASTGFGSYGALLFSLGLSGGAGFDPVGKFLLLYLGGEVMTYTLYGGLLFPHGFFAPCVVRRYIIQYTV